MPRLFGTLILVCLYGTSAWGVDCSTSPGDCTYFWLSTDNFLVPSPLPDDPTKVPEFYNFKGQPGGSFYIWARPEVGQTLKNWSLNLMVSDSSIIDAMTSDVYEDGQTVVMRWQSIGEPNGNATQIKNIAGFTQTTGGLGIGPGTQSTDDYYDAARNAWLLARVDYTLKPYSSYASANLFLQIGSLGMTNTTGSSMDVDVVFGHQGDNSLNAFTNRQTSSNSPDGVIKYFDKPDADFDDNTKVNGRDFLIWQRNYGTTTLFDTDGNANAGGGSGQDDDVNRIDLAAWQFQYGTIVSPTLVDSLQVIPEPSSLRLALWAFSGMLAIGRRRQRHWRGSTSGDFRGCPAKQRIRPSVADVTE